jgi:hypothetical protein
VSEQDAFIRESVREARRIVVESMTQWMTVRFTAGHRDYTDKVAMRQVKLVVTRALTAGAGWRDIRDAIARVAARPADRKGYVYALEDEIGNVGQERRERERSATAGVSLEAARQEQDARWRADWHDLQVRHPGMTAREILRAEGLDPFHRPA